jgi:hypothetical protein
MAMASSGPARARPGLFTNVAEFFVTGLLRRASSLPQYIARAPARRSQFPPPFPPYRTNVATVNRGRLSGPKINPANQPSI